jgi:hypothetical protein
VFVLLTEFQCSPAAFEKATGWAIKPEGACKADVCVPLGVSEFDLATTCEKLGMAVVHDRDLGVWSIGPETLGGRALVAAEAPDLRLPDLGGNEFRLRSLRGKKVALVAWAPY